MKLTYFMFLGCFGTKIAEAQSKPVILLNQATRDSLQQPKNEFGTMPNSLKDNGQHFQLKLKGNNQLGFDIYESQLDKMIVLIPDSVNKASLGLTASNFKRLVIRAYPTIQQYQHVPLTRPLGDALLIPDFNTKPFNPKNEQSKRLPR